MQFTVYEAVLLKITMFALVDCNNFYVSCERLFRPDLKTKPVVVLSNNDGCIISRSSEVKQLGIKMGTPIFKVSDLIKKHCIHTFSSNFPLYGDISNRVMNTLEDQSSALEIYSIDEAFVDLNKLPFNRWKTYGLQVQKLVHQNIGIPVCVGLAPTKTLAKVANQIAKNQNLGVFCIFPNTIDQALRSIQLKDIWGIGSGSLNKLSSYNIHFPIDFASLSPFVVQRLLGIKGCIVHQELQGSPALTLQTTPSSSKSITYSRTLASKSFSHALFKSILAHFSELLASKLRKKRLFAGVIRLFLKTSSHQRKPAEYFSQQRSLLHISQDSRQILRCLQSMTVSLNENNDWRKIGVMALDLSSKAQCSLMPSKYQSEVMTIMDKINHKMGAQTLQLAASLHATKTQAYWKKQAHLSQKYTTQWSEIPLIHI